MALTKVSGPLLHGSNDNLGNYVINNITGAAATFTGNVSVGGTLTYDDVTNVESVGIVTAKGGLHVGAGGTIIYALSEDNGKVGIGTTDASHQITVYAKSANSTIARFKAINRNSNFDIITDASSHGQARVRNNIGATKVQLSSNDVSYFTGGDVGIGTDNPSQLLELFATNPTIALKSFGSDNDASIELSESAVHTNFGEANNGGFRIRYDGGVNKLLFDSGLGTDINTRLSINRDNSKVGVGLTNPEIFHAGANHLVIQDSGSCGLTIDATSSSNSSIFFADGADGNEAYRGWVQYTHGDGTNSDYLTLGTAAEERIRFTSDGKTFIHGTGATGTNNTSTLLPNGYTLNIHGTSSNDGISVVRYSADYGAYGLNIGKSNNSTFGTNTLVTDNEELGHISFYGADGTDFNMAAQITGEVDGTPSDGTDMPGALTFKTSSEASGTPTERLRIANDGQITQTAASGDTIITLKRSDTNTTGLTGGINFAASDGHSVASIQARGDGNNEGAHLQFYTTTAAAGDMFNAANVERLRITSTGLVKIKEASPVASTNGENALLQVKSVSQYDGLLLGTGYEYGTIGRGAAGALTYTGNASPGNLGGTEKIMHDWWSGSAGGGGPNRLMVLTTSGNLGIGTSIPGTQLHLSGATPIIRLTDTDTAGPLHTNIDGASGNLFLDVGSVHRDVIITSVDQTNEIARFEGDGNVGIGTNDPNMTLHVKSTSDDVVRFQSTNATNGAAITLDHIGGSPADNDIAGKIVFNAQDDALNSTTYADIRCITSDVSNGTETAHLDFSTRGLGSFAAVFRINRRSTASAPSYTADDADGVILDVYNTGNPYPRYMNFIAKSAGNTDSNIGFWTEKVGGSPIERLRITNNGHVSIISGNLEFANGAGIDFSNVPDGSRSIDSDGNKLDDYEEGSFTPYYYTQNSLLTANYVSQDGKYTKIGRFVHFQIYLRLSSKSGGSGHLRIYGLPFSSSDASGAAYGGGVVAYTNNWDNDAVDRIMIGSGSDQVQLFVGTSSGTNVNAGAGNLNNDTQLRIFGSYQV